MVNPLAVGIAYRSRGSSFGMRCSVEMTVEIVVIVAYAIHGLELLVYCKISCKEKRLYV